MEWFGSLPNRWNTRKINELFFERKEKVSDKDNAPLSVSKSGIVPQIATVAKTNDGDNRKRVCKGDFVINSRSDRRGSSGISQYDGSVSLINIVLSPRVEHNGRYFHYLLRSQTFIEEYYRNGRGIVADLWTTRYTEMKNIYLPFPPREEQDQIVRFLDWKISQINKLINAKRRQIALLQEQRRAVIDNAVTKGLNPYAPIKNSGIPWVGVMPSSWITTQIKNHFHIEKRIAGQEGFDVLSITQAGIKVKDISTNEGQMASSYTNYQIVNPGEFAMNHMDLLTGYVDISKLFGVTSPDYRVFILDDMDSCCPDFYLHLFQLCYARRVFYGFGRGASTKGRWRMPKTSFLNFDIPLPPKDEQVKIVTYIGSQCANIDRLISKLNTEMQLFTEYRTRLISDAVTGKHDVRGVAVPEYETVDDMPTDETEPPDDEKSEREDDE